MTGGPRIHGSGQGIHGVHGYRKRLFKILTSEQCHKGAKEFFLDKVIGLQVARQDLVDYLKGLTLREIGTEIEEGSQLQDRLRLFVVYTPSPYSRSFAFICGKTLIPTFFSQTRRGD